MSQTVMPGLPETAPNSLGREQELHEMFTKCLNPGCQRPFDYREGQLVRCSICSPGGHRTPNQPLVEHFWLCGLCSESYVLMEESGTVRMKRRAEHSRVDKTRSLVTAA